MNEEQVLVAIANFCQEDTLNFQIIIQDNTLHIYINRLTDNLDYQNLTNKIHSAIVSLKWVELKEIWLYSRMLGEVEPDWQTYIEIKDKEYGIVLMEDIESLAEEIEDELTTTGTLIKEWKNQPQMSQSLVEKIKIELKTTGSLITKLKNELETEI